MSDRNEIEAVRDRSTVHWIVLSFNNTPNVQLTNGLSESGHKLFKTVLKVEHDLGPLYGA